jgi:hypothetical protein
MGRIVNSLAALCLAVVLAVAQRPPVLASEGLPPGVLKALAREEKSYCDQWLGKYKKGSQEKFRQNLRWRRLLIAPSGQMAILVENRNMGNCGSAGCSLLLFIAASKNRFVQALGKDGDVGDVARFKVKETVTNRHYDLQKTWADGQTRTLFKWDGVRYSPVS